MIPEELKDCINKPFPEMVRRVLEYSKREHQEPIQGINKGLAIIFDELREACQAEDTANVFMELASVAAMCQRTVEDLRNALRNSACGL